jgi:hypothetical protein
VVGTGAGLFGLYVANTSTQHMSNIDILYIYNLDFLIFINGVPFFYGLTLSHMGMLSIY